MENQPQPAEQIALTHEQALAVLNNLYVKFTQSLSAITMDQKLAVKGFEFLDIGYLLIEKGICKTPADQLKMFVVTQQHQAAAAPSDPVVEDALESVPVA